MSWSPQRRTANSRLIQLRTDASGNSPWIILGEGVQWWQVLGSPSNAAYQIQVRPQSANTIAVAVQVVGLNVYRSDVFVGSPDLQVRVTIATPNTVYLLAVQGGDMDPA